MHALLNRLSEEYTRGPGFPILPGSPASPGVPGLPLKRKKDAFFFA